MLSFGIRARSVSLLSTLVVLMALVAACSSEDPEANTAPATPTATTQPAAGVPDAPDTPDTPDAIIVTPTPVPSSGSTVAFPIECPIRGGHLIMGNAKEITNPTPFTASSVDHYIKAASMYEPLVAQAKDGSIQGILAESWQANKDQSAWDFKLREGVKFHDGTEMTSADVIWSALFAKDPQNAATGSDEMRNVVSIEALGPYEVRFNLTGPNPLFLLLLESVSTLPVVPEGALATGEIAVQVGPAGTGPFKFVKWVPSDKIVVERFDDYWRGPTCLDGITFQLIAQVAGRQNALRAGDVQIVERASVEFNQRVSVGDIRGITSEAATLSGFRRFAFNQTSPVFSNQTIRLAAIYAMDMKALLDEAFFGEGYLMGAAVPPGSPWEQVLQDCCPLREADHEKSKELLAQAGYNNEEVTLIVERGQGEPIGESVARSMRNGGFNVKLVVLESGVYDERQADGDFDLTPKSESWQGDGMLSLFGSWTCENSPVRVGNTGGYCNPEFDALVESSITISDLQQRLDIYGQAKAILYEDAVGKWMGYNYTRYFAWSDNVHNFAQLGNGGYQDFLGLGLQYVWLDAE
jgi:peptide/nickel transport system substrate-binding protein